MGVTVRERPNKDGTASIYLDIIHNGQRNREFLKNLKLVKSSNPTDRQVNKENRDLAKKIAAKRAQELEASDYGILTSIGKRTFVLDWMQSYTENYDKRDKRNMEGALRHFKQYLTMININGLTFNGLDDLLITGYRDYLLSISHGEGGASYFARFKKMITRAYKEKLMSSNPGDGVKIIRKESERKDILTLEEIRILAQTQIKNTEIKRAFLFSCMTGLRWCDVKSLDWKSIDFSNKSMKILQEKTSRSVTVNLNANAIQLLGQQDDENGFVFKLPSSTGCNKTLKAWVKRAKITKKITWHNARHSFGTNLIYNNIDVLTASKLLGHTSLKHTLRYVDAADEMKRKATDILNIDLQ